MVVVKKRTSGWDRRKKRVGKKITSTPDRPRLNVYRSNRHIYAQIVEDMAGKTIIAASTMTEAIKDEVSKLSKTDAARKVGEYIGRLAKEKGVGKVVFDRSGYLYHGRVKALADGVRASGINF
ncbi:MAG: 50S ribosomal protein L18 [Deltaproteobacteria bacterium]|nr:50S ribosomal protein L18 [Deltaproteobacteria bacterium]